MPKIRMLGAAALALATALALAGCGQDGVDQAADQGGGSSGSAAATGAGAGQGDAEDADESDAETTDAEGEEAFIGEKCLYGDWLLDNDAFAVAMRTAGGDVRSVTGQAIVTYNPDGSTTATFHGWTTVAVQEHAEATMVRNGVDQGVYTVSGDMLTTTETAGDSVLMMTMKMDGQDAIAVEAPHEPFSVSTGTFTCDAKTLTVVAEGVRSVLLREP